MNAVTKAAAGGALALLQGLKKNIANVQQTLVKKSGEPYLRLLREGAWVYGQDDTEVEAGSVWAINPLSIRHGWCAWRRGIDPATKKAYDNSGGPVHDIMVPASQPMPALTDLPALVEGAGAEWAQQFSVSLRCVTGTDKGEQVLYKTNSVSGVAEFDKLLTAIGEQLDRDPENPVPCATLEVDSYNHKQHKKIYTPVINIQTWVAMTEDLPDVQGDMDEEATEAGKAPAPEPVKATRTRKAAEPVNEPVVEDLDEDPEIAEMMRQIAAKKAAKDAQTAPVDPEAAAKAKRKAELEAMLAELNGGATADAAPATSSAAPQRRRRA